MREINKVVLHNTAVLQETQPSSKKMITSMSRRHKDVIGQFKDKNGSTCSYHFFVGIEWDITQTREIESVGYANSNPIINKEAINICVHWYFDKEKPNEKQYKAVAKIIKQLKLKYEFTLHLHNEYANKTCPWKNFDFSLVKSMIEPNKPLIWKRYSILAKMNSYIYKKISDRRIKEYLRIINKIIRGEV